MAFNNDWFVIYCEICGGWNRKQKMENWKRFSVFSLSPSSRDIIRSLIIGLDWLAGGGRSGSKSPCP
jgi:hypothetical protein